MTNTIAISLAVLILGALAYDAVQNDWNASVFLGRKGLELIEYLAFWR